MELNDALKEDDTVPMLIAIAPDKDFAVRLANLAYVLGKQNGTGHVFVEGQHTPGPWMATHSVPEEGYDCWWITSNSSGSNREKEIATVAGGYPQDKHACNAKLIAASPAMEDALIQLIFATSGALNHLCELLEEDTHIECLIDAINCARRALPHY